MQESRWTWSRWVGRVVAIGVLTGCSGGVAEEAAPAPAANVEEAARVTPDEARTFFATLRRDDRACVRPRCAHVFVSPVHRERREPRELPASSLDLRESGLDAAAALAVHDAPDRDLVVYGRFGPRDAAGERPFVVVAAYRGMPGVRARAGDELFQLDASASGDSQGAACRDAGAALRAHLLDDPRADVITPSSISVTATARTGVDPAWLESRVLAHGAIVAAHPLRRSSLLSASQVFVRLPDVVGPCPALAAPRCSPGTTATYERDAERCVRPTGCVSPAPCPFAVLACEEGYVSMSWPTGPGACPRVACDPSFLVGDASRAASSHAPSSGEPNDDPPRAAASSSGAGPSS